MPRTVRFKECGFCPVEPPRNLREDEQKALLFLTSQSFNGSGELTNRHEQQELPKNALTVLA
jgi:hypothetical protein